ncbi:hypothetical protein [Litoribacter populi]|nr:hypothetical protein [Litoribacter populi]
MPFPILEELEITIISNSKLHPEGDSSFYANLHPYGVNNEGL